MSWWDQFMGGVQQAIKYTSPVGLVGQMLQQNPSTRELGQQIQTIHEGIQTMIPGEPGKIARHSLASGRSLSKSSSVKKRQRKRKGTHRRRHVSFRRH